MGELHLDLTMVEHCPAKFKRVLDDSPGLRSMGQRVPWPPQYKRSTSQGRCRCTLSPYQTCGARGSNFIALDGLTPYAEEQPLGEKRVWSNMNPSFDLNF